MCFDFAHLEYSKPLQFLPLGDKAIGMLSSMFPDYPQFKKGDNCAWHIIICDDVISNNDYLNNVLVDNRKEYTPFELILDLNTQAQVEKLRSKWKYYKVLDGHIEQQYQTLELLLRFFKRHIFQSDYIMSFDSGSMTEFLASGDYLKAKAVEGYLGDGKIMADVLHATAQDAKGMVMAYYQPLRVQNGCITFGEELSQSIRNISDILNEYDKICYREGKCLKCRQTFCECKDNNPETIILSLRPANWDLFFAQDLKEVDQ